MWEVRVGKLPPPRKQSFAFWLIKNRFWNGSRMQLQRQFRKLKQERKTLLETGCWCFLWKVYRMPRSSWDLTFPTGWHHCPCKLRITERYKWLFAYKIGFHTQTPRRSRCKNHIFGVVGLKLCHVVKVCQLTLLVGYLWCLFCRSVWYTFC